MLVTLDFETEAIQDRPNYPPEPVGCAVKIEDQPGYYLSWGHPVGNNTSREEAVARLRDLWRDNTLLFFNAKFDYEVGVVRLGMPEKPWHEIHDAMFSVFMHDPHARELSLKPSAERILGMPPEERDAVFQWLVNEGIAKIGDKRWGRFICMAPGDLVGKYAVGDVDRTYLLHKKLTEDHDEHERRAYDRERRLLPILLRNEQEGMRIDVERLTSDLKIYEGALVATEDWVRKRLDAPTLELSKSIQLAEALDRAGMVTDWVLTPTGRKSTSKKNMTVDKITDKQVAEALGYHNRLSTALKMSMRPWMAMAEATGGYIYTSWNQVRQADEGWLGGTRTGRMSCPYFMNITKDWSAKGDYTYPSWLGQPDLPLVRTYILPDEDGTFLHRDYSQQEFRILAHYEDDALLRAYRENPRIDIHDFMGREIERITHHKLRRGPVKILNFGILYGMGLEKLAKATGTWDTTRCLDGCAHVSLYGGDCHAADTAKEVRAAQRHALPGLGRLEERLQTRGRNGESIRTWGGRYYHCEPPAFRDGRWRTFEYKLLNYLIQGSAADCTKEAVIRYNESKDVGRFLVTVHDEINISAPKGAVKSEMAILKRVMESIEFDVPMLTDGKTGPSWGELTKYED